MTRQSGASGATPSTLPNVLVIMSDQHAPGVVGALGHPCVKTPHIDALAARGMAFTQAYCPYPMCTPSRAGFMTGLLTPQHNVWELGSVLNAGIPTWAHALGRGGYVTSIAGRMHFIGLEQHHGYHRRVWPDTHDKLRPYAYDAWLKPIEDEHVMLSAVKGAGPTAEPNRHQNYDTDLTTAALAELEFLAGQRQSHGKPWSLTAGYIQPHTPYTISQDLWDLYEDVEIDLPPEPPDGGSFLAHIPPQMEGSRRWLGNTADGLTHDQVRCARRAYYAMVTRIDQHVGQLVAKLEALGELENTLIVYTSDHGDNIGNHGAWSKLNFFQDSVAIPMIIAGPGVSHGVCRSPVSLIDWLPTMLEVSGQRVETWPLTLPGRSLVNLWRDAGNNAGSDAGGDRVVISDYACGGTRVPLRMVRRGAYKACFGPPFPPVLYDLENDPHEWHDLGSDPAHQGLIAELEVIARADGWDPQALLAHIQQEKRMLRYIQEVEGADVPGKDHLS